MNKRERIEQAVIDCGAKWPYGENKMIAMSLGDGEQCTRAEFEHVAGDCRELYDWRRNNIIEGIPPFRDWVKSDAYLFAIKIAAACNFNWRTPLPTEQPATEQANSWHEAWELPQVGEVVEIRTSTKKWHSTDYTICGYSPSFSHVFIWDRENSYPEIHSLSEIEFRPIKSERERVIEFALAQDCEPHEGSLSRKDFCGKLFDIGALKMPDEK